MNHPTPAQADRVAAAFSQQSAVEAPNAILHWMRGRVRNQVLGPGSHLLEFNAGTGLDAVQVSRQGLGALVPPPHLINFPRRFPRLFGLLCRWETQVAAWSPFRSWADHIVVSAQYRG